MKITKRQLRKMIREWRENPAKIRRQRRIKDRQRMIDQMTFKQLKRRAFDSALFINNRLDTGQYEYADIWEAEIPGLADTIDAAKVKAAEEGVTYDDIPEVRYQGGILDLSKYSLPGLPAGITESKIKITKRQLRRIIKEAMGDEPIRMAPGDSFSPEQLRALTQKKRAPEPKRMAGSFSDTIVLSPEGDSVLVKGEETYIQDVPYALEIMTGFGMSDTDADNLIFALEDQMADGYVELEVTYNNGQWSW